MLLVNTETIPGKTVEALGLVTGGCIMCKNVGKDIGAAFRNMVGGEMQAYTKMMMESKDKAVEAMVAEAKAMGADAVVGVRFTSSNVIDGGAEILAAGTAVRFH